MRSQHRHPYRSLREWHAGQRAQRRAALPIPYSLRWRGGVLLRILPQIVLSGFVAVLSCLASNFAGESTTMHSPILFPVFGFITGLAITFRMQSSYSRWTEGRTQWDQLSAVSRSFARTVWLHVPDAQDIMMSPEDNVNERLRIIRCIYTLGLALKHHLRGERDWATCKDLKYQLSYLDDYNYSSTNHPLSLTLHLSRYIEDARLKTKLDTQVLSHLLTHVDIVTSIISACERLLRTPIPLGYNIAISRIVWIFTLALPSQLWGELRWWSIAVTMVVSYALFALAEVGLEIENPWGEGPNDLDLDRYCNLLALDLEDITAGPLKERQLFDDLHLTISNVAVEIDNEESEQDV